jgi:MFS family permease
MSTSAASAFKELDESGITPLHWKIMFISGMGFFTDAYDLFIIGVVLTLLKTEWHLSSFQVALVGSTALLAAALGAIVFGRIADVIGRKKIYGYEVLVLAAGAVASAFSPDIWWLIAFRFILGVGIGGDYPVSATIMSEFAGTKTRGMMVSLVFAMQGLGLIVGPLVAIVLLKTNVSHDFAWRIMLALGAVPAMSVFWMRRQLKETPRFEALTQGKPRPKTSFREEMGVYKKDPTMLRWLIGASAAWFLLDVAYYGNTLSSPLVVKAINPNADLLHTTEITLAIFAIAAFPGYLAAAGAMDRLGRKTIQLIGFAFMALAFAGIAFLPGGQTAVVPFVLLYGLSYFFAEFGPNTTTFVFPSEIFPARVRTTSHGITATSGKIGAFIGTLLFPLVMDRFGLPGAMAAVSAVAVLGLLTTWWLLPEPKGKSLEEISREDLARIRQHDGAAQPT